MKRITILLLLVTLTFSCKDTKKHSEEIVNKHEETVKIEYAKGFSIKKFEGYSLLTVNSPWPKADKSYTYLLKEKDAKTPDNIPYDEELTVPLQSIVFTSTTHIPALEALNEESSLTGFPDLDFISSKKTRKLIDNGKIKELGENENINTEILIDLNPDAVIAFSVDGSNKSLKTIQKTGIPVIYNGDWTENTPLGKAEWIKFFGVLFQKETAADSIFNNIKNSYKEARQLAFSQKTQPTVLSGSMYRDRWYLPYGNSWQAQLIKDANANYIYQNTTGDGSMALSFESVLEKASNADYWISAGQFESYEQLFADSQHYQEFKAVQDRKVYTVSLTKGETGGVLFYELGPHRPDLILKDLINIFHPDALSNYKPVFFKPLK